jgi:L-lactate dehydrogenase (cytochrome)
MRVHRIYNVDDARTEARLVLPRALFDYVDGGSDDETTLRANQTAFEDAVLRPSMGAAVCAPDLSVVVLGKTLSSPVMLAPCGLVSLVHPSGAIGAASAAARRGTISVLSSLAGSGVDEVTTAAPSSVWFQLYHQGDRATAEALMARARCAGVDVLVVTIDTAAYGNRERDRRHGVGVPLDLRPRNSVHLAAQLIRRPRWTATMGAKAYALLSSGSGWGDMETDNINAPSPFSWDDVQWLSELWPGKLVVKGVLTGADARRAVDHGADGVIVSNHGGRQLDGTVATFRALPEVVAAVEGAAEVFLDGGVRRGTHVVKALAVGARAVLVGRPYVWGLAVAGKAGVQHVLDLLDREVVRALTLLGCSSLSKLSIEWLGRSDGRPWPQ